MRHIALILAATLVASPVLAQSSPEPPPAMRAMTAGYKALMVCGAVFNTREAGAERSLDSIRDNELTGIYAELDPLVREMPMEVGDHFVRVPWGSPLPDRLAVHTPGRGCAIAPVGAETLPEREPIARAAPMDWPTAEPRGDAEALDAALSGA
ncbi:MAG: hypothetical protein DI570_29545, partial [Phenylobacterium zucineum]